MSFAIIMLAIDLVFAPALILIYGVIAWVEDVRYECGHLRSSWREYRR